jgi:hypothetical protein
MSRATTSKLLIGAAALPFVMVGMDIVSPLLTPLDYVEVPVPSVVFWIPVELAVLGIFLLIWPAPPTQDKHRRRVAYGVRICVFLVFCAVGFYTPYAYVERSVEFIPIPEKEIGMEQELEWERTLGFKVGLESGSRWQRVFFKRVPGREEKVRKLLQERGTLP